MMRRIGSGARRIVPPRFLATRFPAIWIVVLVVTLARSGAWAQDEGTAEADTSSAESDSTLVESLPDEATGPGGSLLSGLENTPEAGVKAKVLDVLYYGNLTTRFTLLGGSTVNNAAKYSYDSFRKQDKTVERRSSNFLYRSGTALPFVLGVNGTWNWSEDITVNNANLRNLNKRDVKSAGVDLGKDFQTGAVVHKSKASVKLNSQKAENQNQRNNISDAAFDGAIRSGTALADGVRMATRLYGTRRQGDGQLGTRTSTVSTTGDSLGAGVYFNRKLISGNFVATKASFDKRYLDFRRNTNGIVDTSDATQSKIVQELEQRNALQLEFNGTVKVGRVSLVTKVTHSDDSEEYAKSGVGRKERLDDKADVTLAFPAGRDSFSVRYAYEWKWDSQTYQGGAESRGKQYTKDRQFYLNWQRQLFRHTKLTGAFATFLTQDIAEAVNGRPFNENDRDRVENDASLKLDTVWQGQFSTSLHFDYKESHDIAVRNTRSANNNVKKTYEISPSYSWPIAPWLTAGQTLRLYIQYQDYDFAYLPSVRKTDNYNKRGTLTTSLKLKPSERVDLDLRYDTSATFNATHTTTDATGRDLYHRDQEQWVSRVDLGLGYQLMPWLKLETATYRSKDRRDTLGNTTRRTDTYSGEIWLGATISKKWGATNPLILAGRVKKYQAYGPNVTENNRDYWDADISLKWSF